MEYWTKPAVMIDDFQVPDSDFGYDEHNGIKLNLDYLSPHSTFELATFFPSFLASEETGEKRGMVILAKDSETTNALRSINLLRSGPKIGGIAPAVG